MNGRCGSIASTAPLTPVYVNFLLQLPTVRKMILIPRLRPPTVPALLQGAALSLKRRREEASWRRQTRGRPVIFRLVGNPSLIRLRKSCSSHWKSAFAGFRHRSFQASVAVFSFHTRYAVNAADSRLRAKRTFAFSVEFRCV